MTKAFIANRYGKGGEEAYINCPLSKEEYEIFVDALLAGETVPPKNFEKEILFQACQPIESIAASGRESLRFGPMKPVGLHDPITGKRHHAVVQLRAENLGKTAYNLVGFQTKLKYGAQAQILRLIPALHQAEFIRMGSIHRNTYLCAPNVLQSDLSLKANPNVFVAGQLTGVEGYLESAAGGLMAALGILSRLKNLSFTPLPRATALGALRKHLLESDSKYYQPMNACFAIYDAQDFEGISHLRKEALRTQMALQAESNFRKWWDSHPLRLKELSNPHNL
jgi:methylenetetrahydrofolate--tRNA-(uracil-5-)-methyltransferase